MTAQMTNPQGVEKFNDGVQSLLLLTPFFGTLLMKLRHEVDDTVPTLYVDGRTIGYSSNFIASLPPAQVMFAIAHEVMHAAWMHVPRLRHYMDTGIGPDGKKLDWALFQKAMDYPVNASLVESRIGEPWPPCCLDLKRFPSSMTPEEVYCILRQQKGPAEGQALDEHRHATPCDPTTGSPEVDAITEADVQQAANVCKAMRGTLPAGIDRLLGQIRKPTVSPWKRIRSFVASTLSGYDSTSWKRLDRRMMARGIGVPGRVAKGAGTIAIVADTSGSIDQRTLTLFAGHMAAIFDDTRPKLVRVYWVDAAVHRRDEFKNISEMRTMLAKKVPGGGGTDMRVGVTQAIEDGCDGVVVLTDGYTPFCDGGKTPVIWAITTDRKSPYGETVHISE